MYVLFDANKNGTNSIMCYKETLLRSYEIVTRISSDAKSIK